MKINILSLVLLTLFFPLMGWGQTLPCNNPTFVKKFTEGQAQYNKGDYKNALSNLDFALKICPKCEECEKMMQKILALDSRKLRKNMRIGKHAITLQWISWDKPGSVEISELSDGTFKIIGGQKLGQDYLKVQGTLKILSETDLLFNGTIESKIYHINSGKPCLRKGDLNFKITQNRKYWRLQEMDNCDGVVTDYIDIYF